MSTRKLLLLTLLINACAEPSPGPAQTPRRFIRPAAPRPGPTSGRLEKLLAEIELGETRDGVPLRKILKRYLPVGQAASVAAMADVTILKVEGDTLLGAFLEVRPVRRERCGGKGADKTRVYWLAMQAKGGGRKEIAATAVKSRMFSGSDPEPTVVLPETELPVPVFKVKVELPDTKLCPQDRFRFNSLKVVEVYSVVGGRINQILRINTEEEPAVSGTSVDNSAELRWIVSPSKDLYLAAIARSKRSTPLNSAPGPGDSDGGTRHDCSRQSTVYEVSSTGASRKLPDTALKKRRKSIPGLAALPKDMTSTVEDACD